MGKLLQNYILKFWNTEAIIYHCFFNLHDRTFNSDLQIHVFQVIETYLLLL